MKLFCFAHAGGSANVYLSWRQHLDRSIELVPVEVSGRGSRIRAPLSDRFADVIDDAVADLTQKMQREYALYGHSFGAILAYEVAHVLAGRGRPPLHLFVSGSCSPDRVGELALPISDDDRTLLASLSYLGGMPHEILGDDEAVSLFAPILRADLRALSDYHYQPRPKLACDVSILLGSDDALASLADAVGWAALVAGRARTRVLRGGHFAPFEGMGAIAWINETLGVAGWATRVS